VAEWLARPFRQERSNCIHLTQRFGAKRIKHEASRLSVATGSKRIRFALLARASETVIFYSPGSIDGPVHHTSDRNLPPLCMACLMRSAK
jgi:hypothetical protein